MKIIATIALISVLPLAAWAAAAGSVSIPVLKSAAMKGQPITADDIVMQDVSASQVFPSTITDPAQLTGMEAVRNLDAFQPINRLHVRVSPVIARGSTVTIRFVKGGVELTSKGQAMEDGRLGQSIRVLNPSSRTTLVGTVQPNGVVEID
jgi:flagella basal body P-ring formation protein FlgA